MRRHDARCVAVECCKHYFVYLESDYDCFSCRNNRSITITIADTGSGLSGTSTLIINKATPTVSVTNSPVTYDGTGKSAAVSGSVAGVASNSLTGRRSNADERRDLCRDRELHSHGHYQLQQPDRSFSRQLRHQQGNADSIGHELAGCLRRNRQVSYSHRLGLRCRSSNILTGGAATQTNAGTYAVTANFTPDGHNQLQQPDRRFCRQLHHQQGHADGVGHELARYV